MRAKTIDDVLTILAAIVADTKAKKDPLGYFPALYRQVTLEVKAGIEQGIFDDGPRSNEQDIDRAREAGFQGRSKSKTALDEKMRKRRVFQPWLCTISAEASRAGLQML